MALGETAPRRLDESVPREQLHCEVLLTEGSAHMGVVRKQPECMRDRRDKDTLKLRARAQGCCSHTHGRSRPRQAAWLPLKDASLLRDAKASVSKHDIHLQCHEGWLYMMDAATETKSQKGD